MSKKFANVKTLPLVGQIRTRYGNQIQRNETYRNERADIVWLYGQELETLQTKQMADRNRFLQAHELAVGWHFFSTDEEDKRRRTSCLLAAYHVRDQERLHSQYAAALVEIDKRHEPPLSVKSRYEREYRLYVATPNYPLPEPLAHAYIAHLSVPMFTSYMALCGISNSGLSVLQYLMLLFHYSCLPCFLFFGLWVALS